MSVHMSRPAIIAWTTACITPDGKLAWQVTNAMRAMGEGEAADAEVRRNDKLVSSAPCAMCTSVH